MEFEEHKRLARKYQCKQRRQKTFAHLGLFTFRFRGLSKYGFHGYILQNLFIHVCGGIHDWGYEAA